MLREMIAGYAALAVLIVGVASAEDAVQLDQAPRPEPMACPSVTSQRAVKVAGQTSGYPASCALPTCRIMNSTAQKTHLEGLMGLPGGYITVLDWRYKIQLGAVPGNACPSDVVAGPWVQP